MDGILLTPHQILAVYDAGRRRGEEEATAFDWGSFPTGEKLDELEGTLVWDHRDSPIAAMDYDEKKAWWDNFKAALTAKGESQ